ncbi:DUF6602 domain-containing protein [Nostoc sp.]|uniref:DUF6602 domain-containing protein n=1 Tax=Nostoc sp. TaxID=1180 RepID=UPI002FFAB43C
MGEAKRRKKNDPDFGKPKGASVLERKLDLLQKQMELRLEEIRASYQHKGNMGSNVEEVIREFLREFLPPHNRIGQGEVVDFDGNSSTQLDLVITNEYHPYLNDLTKPSVFFIEGIACVGEVKSVLNSNDFDSILRNCLTYKQLKVNLQDGMRTFINPSDLKRFVEKRPYFLFAFESQLSLSTLLEKTKRFNTDNNLDFWQQIDGIFILNRGQVINFGDGQGTFQFADHKGNTIPGLISIDIEEDPKVLFGFLSWLNSAMPRIEIQFPILMSYLMKGQIPINAGR